MITSTSKPFVIEILEVVAPLSDGVGGRHQGRQHDVARLIRASADEVKRRRGTLPETTTVQAFA